MTLGERFGANLKRARRRRDLCQEELGFRTGLHRTEVGMLERGIRLPRIDTLVRLAGAADVRPGELLRGLRWTPPDVVSGRLEVADPDEEP